MALAISAAVAVPSFAQRPPANPAPSHPATRPPGPQRQPQRQAQGQARPQQQRAQQARNERPNPGANRPPNSNGNRAATTPNNNPNRPLSAYTPPPKKFNDLSPQEKRRVVDSYNKQKNLTPAQRQVIDKRIKNWQQLTPEQKNHVRNDLVPKWNQMPKTRQDPIQHRLEVLQNMPESARNQHLNDPNFTRGMSEEDKAMLRDLSHMHMGAPDAPRE